MSDNINEQFYDALGMDDEIRVALRRTIRDCRIFATMTATGVKPFDIQILATSLQTNSQRLLDALALRYGSLESAIAGVEPLDVETTMSEEETEMFRAALDNTEKKAKRIIEEGDPDGG